MIDISLLRENPSIIKENIKKKFQTNKLALVDEAIKKDTAWRKLKTEADSLRADRNKISKEISEAKKANKKSDVTSLLKKAKDIPEEIDAVELKASKLETEISEILSKLPNIMHPSVPIGQTEAQNKTIEVIGKPNKSKFEIKNHAELLESLNQADFNASAKTSGNGFYYLQRDIALLNQALLRFVIDKIVEEQFVYVETPLMLRGDVIEKVTDLNDMKNQIYKIQDEDLYLIGTSEHSLIGRYIDTILNPNALPIKQASYSMCFRKEIGSHGIDEKGLYRTHQFNKIETVVICKPEDSMTHFNELKALTIKIFKELGIPIRVLSICSGDLGDLKHIQVDIEAWSPRKEAYFEVGSCSNLTDAQARRLKIRVDSAKGKFVPHTLNNTAIATSRALVAILENYQQKSGEIKVPEVLLPYMYGKTIIGNKKEK